MSLYVKFVELPLHSYRLHEGEVITIHSRMSDILLEKSFDRPYLLYCRNGQMILFRETFERLLDRTLNWAL